MTIKIQMFFQQWQLIFQCQHQYIHRLIEILCKDAFTKQPREYRGDKTWQQWHNCCSLWWSLCHLVNICWLFCHCDISTEPTTGSENKMMDAACYTTMFLITVLGKNVCWCFPTLYVILLSYQMSFSC